jgi:hypothetical protein
VERLRRLRTEQPVLFWVLLFVGIYVAFQVVLYAVGALLGSLGLGLPGWLPIVVVLGVLVLVARRQNR